MPKRSYRAAWIVGTIAVVIVGMVGTIVGVGWFAYSMVSQVASKATEISLPPNSFPTESVNEVVPPEAKTVASAPLVFPALPPATTLAGTDIKVYDVRFTSLTQSQMRTRIYMPRGSHEHASLGCIFTAPAGTPLLHGVELGSEDNMEEILPYVQAGLVVAVYELDGPMPENVTPEMGRAFFDAMKSGYDRFVKAEAGVLNGKSAIDFVLARVPEVDPKKLYSSGHSSAGTLSLLLAAKDSRIAKCIAFSPATDLNRRIGEIARDPSAAAIFANFKEYCVSGSPITYASQYRCPIFILHAMDDDNEPFTSTRTFVMRLKSPSVTFVRERNGGHYEPMVRVGLPKAIEWLKK
jgi:dienelactone hydrolase